MFTVVVFMYVQYLSLMKELGEVVPGADSAPKPVSSNPIVSGTAVPPPASLVSSSLNLLLYASKVGLPTVQSTSVLNFLLS